MNYHDFLSRKSHLGGESGFAPAWEPDFLFDFQQFLVGWALRKGRGAVFADCGLGKTPMQLVWAENVRRKAGRPVLVVTPLAVAPQTVAEAEKFGVEARVSRDGRACAPVTVTNYERLHLFDWEDYAGVVCDESSAIKAFDGKRRALVTEFLRVMPYRLLCTATAAPNDYVELGTSSEALGEMGHTDMLNRFFTNKERSLKARGNIQQGRYETEWRFKGHAEVPFWRWVSSWARALRRPSDFGFDDAGFHLPPLDEREHIVRARVPAPGLLFELPARGLDEQRAEARRTVEDRCERAAALAGTGEPVVLWCNLNAEGDLLAKLLPDFVQVKGSDPLEVKEEAFAGFSTGAVRGLITKAKIGAWGLNWQHCAHTIVFPSHSYEQYYQLVRRFWRFGQKRPVRVDVVTTESGHDVMENLKRKARQADRMFSALVAHMNEAQSVRIDLPTNNSAEVPAWL